MLVLKFHREAKQRCQEDIEYAGEDEPRAALLQAIERKLL
jgi:hypothetical protein